MLWINQFMNWQRISTFIKKYQIWLLLSLGLIIGLTFVFLVPPWMHYDEPGHFEYAWLIANQGGLPQRGEYDQTMRRELSASIIEHNMETYTGMVSDPNRIDQPIDIFLPQVEDHPPTYYLLAAIPLRLFRHSDIVFQLRLVRLFSLSLFLTLIWVSYRVCLVLFEPGHPLIWMVPLFLMTLPSFVDIMTAANNDAAANLAFALFVWASVSMIKKGASWLKVLLLLAATFLCAFSKSTALLAIPLSPLVILLALLRGKKGGVFVWVSLALLVMVGGAFLFTWRDSAPAYFYGADIHANPRSAKDATAPLGQTIILQGMQEARGRPFYHLLSRDTRESLQEKPSTLGAWIWAEEPTTTRFPYVSEGQIWIPNLSSLNTRTAERIRLPFVSDRQVAEPVTLEYSQNNLQLTTEPQFFAFSTTLPPMEGNISWIVFLPTSDRNVQVFWDGIVLVEGDFTDTPPPVFDDPDGTSGAWQGVRFDNMIQNASGEQEWPIISEKVSRLLDIPNRAIPSPSLMLSVLDSKATSVYFQLAGERIFRTFWSVFGWANVPLSGQKPYRFFMILSLVYVLGIILATVRNHYRFSAQIYAFLGIVALSQVFITVIRGVGSWFSTTYIPVGRYLYPTIIPIGIWLMGGVDQLILTLHKYTRIYQRVLYAGFVCLQTGILIWAILSLLIFYR